MKEYWSIISSLFRNEDNVVRDKNRIKKKIEVEIVAEKNENFCSNVYLNVGELKLKVKNKAELLKILGKKETKW